MDGNQGHKLVWSVAVRGKLILIKFLYGNSRKLIKK